MRAQAIHISTRVPKSTVVSVGRFQLELAYGDRVFDGIQWSIRNDEAVLPGEFPLSGRIPHGTDSAAVLIILLGELSRYDRHLAVSEKILADPKRYEAEAKKQIQAEEKAAKAAQDRALEAAEEEARRLEEAQAQREAELEAAREEAYQEAVRQAEEQKQRRLEQRIRSAAERDMSAR